MTSKVFSNFQKEILMFHSLYLNQFNFFIYKTDIENLDERLYLESFLINLCKKLGVNLINDHISFIKTSINFDIGFILFFYL